MPQYHNNEYLKVKPVSLWRKVFKRWPYFVGDRVKFELMRTSPPSRYTVIEVRERFGQQEGILMSIRIPLTVVVGSVIPHECDVVYSVGYSSGETAVIFTAKVLNHDTVFFQWFWFILGALVTFVGIVLAWVLGYIQIIW